MGIEAQTLAEAAAAAMYSRDRASQALGITLDEIGPGRARMHMTVREDMVNGHDLCHGGLIFTLADSTFAFACNSHNQSTVAAGCSIEFLAPARRGDVLTAIGEEQALLGRNGVYDIRVEDQNGRLIAMFRGKSARIRGEVAPSRPR
jgi:acyl-CoA thioesterase